jgi:hypothetical protein
MKIKGNFLSAGLALSLLMGGVTSANAATYQAENNNGMFGLQFENTNDVGGGQSAGWIEPGDWVQWNINVTQTGNYKLTTRSATINPSGVEVYIDGAYTAELGLSNTNSWTTWQSFQSVAFPLTAGNHTLRVRFATAGQNLNWVQLDQVSSGNAAEAFTVGDWRLASRADRTTLGQNGSTSSFISEDYLALPKQHWRLLSRGGNNYDFKLQSTQTCLSRVNGAPALASCNTAASSWTVELLRARGVDRPAIYRLKSPQNTCLIPPVNSSSAPTIGSCDTAARWYLEPVGFGERDTASQYEVRGLLIVKPSVAVIDPAHGVDAQGSLSQSHISASQVSFQTGVKTWLENITDKRVTWVGSSVVASEPIRSLSYATYSNTWWQHPVTGQKMVWNLALERFEYAPANFDSTGYEWTNFLPAAVNVPNDVQRFVPRGTYDTVQVFFPETIPGGWGWGPGQSAQSNYTLWTTVAGNKADANSWLSSNNEPTEVFIHEMMHGYDSHYDQLGVALPEGYLHGAESNRYGYYKGIEGWVHWYRDYWLGTVIATDDTYRGYGPRMFTMQTIRQYALAQPESITKIVQSTSGKCLSTKNGLISPPAGTEVVFSSNCSTDASSFVLQADGMLRHKSSGYCVHPSGGTPYSGVQLVVWPSCTAHTNLPVDINDDGNIRNIQSGLCVRPSSGLGNPAEGTDALYVSGCNQDYLRFTFNRY